MCWGSPSKPTGLGSRCAEATGLSDQGSQGEESRRELVKHGCLQVGRFSAGLYEEEGEGSPPRSTRASSLHSYHPYALVEHQKGTVQVAAERSWNWGPEDPALLRISCVTLDRSLTFSLLICKTESEIPAQTVSRKGCEAQNNGCAL